MKIRLVSSLAALVVVAGFSTPGSAAADAPGWPLECVTEAPSGPGFRTVYFDDTGRLRINPAAAPDDAGAWADHAPTLAVFVGTCLIEPIPTEPAFCIAGRAWEIGMSLDPMSLYLRYVYPDPENEGGFVVDIPQLLSDVAYLSQC